MFRNSAGTQLLTHTLIFRILAVLLCTESPSLRLQHVTHVLTNQLSIGPLPKLARRLLRLLTSPSKQNKVHFLCQQLAAINAELQHLEPGNTDLHGTGGVAEDEKLCA